MLTVKHYDHEQTAANAPEAIKAAQAMLKLYGGNRPPIIEAENDADAKDLVNTQMVAQTSFPVRVNGEAFW